MSYQGRAMTNGPSIVSTVQSGDLLAAVVTASNYLLREGQSTFNPADVLLPTGWTLVDWWVAIPGGDPRRISVVRLLIARIADANTAGSRPVVASAIPYYENDQDAGSSRVEWSNFNPAERHGAGGYGMHYWRGEKGISAFDRVAMSAPAHTVELLPGRSRDGDASVLRFLTWVWGGTSTYSWVPKDEREHSDYNPPLSISNPDVASQGAGGLAYCWEGVWTGTQTIHYAFTGTAVTHALSVTTANYPLAPVIDAPTDGALLDVERDGLSVRWTHRPALAGEQAGWALRMVRGNDAPQWWDASAGAWSGAVVKNSGALASVDLPASAFSGATGIGVAISVATHGANGELSTYSAPVRVTGTPAPSAAASFVGVDAAGMLASLRPQVSISGAPFGSLALDRWESSLSDVTNGRELAASSGAFDGATSATFAPGVEVENGARLVAVVRVRQTGGAWSQPVTVEATADVTTPGEPSLSATTGEHPDSGAPSVRLSVEFPWETDGYPWEARPTVLRVQRSDEGAWIDVAALTMPAGRVAATLDDHAAPSGAVSYRARGEGQAVDGSRLVGPWGTLASALEVRTRGEWIIDPTRPETATRVGLVEQASRSRDLRSVRMAALGRADELVATRVALLDAGELTVRVDNPAQHARLFALLESGAVLKVVFPREQDVFSGEWQQDETLWLRPVGEIVTARLARGPFAVRNVSFSWIAQRPPVTRGEAT